MDLDACRPGAAVMERHINTDALEAISEGLLQ